MDDRLRHIVEAQWEKALGVDRSLLRGGGVHVVAGQLGANDAMAFLFGDTCIVLVDDGEVEPARATLAGADPSTAFTVESLRRLLGPDARVDGPSVHMYVDEEGFVGTSDHAAIPVEGGDAALLQFLRSNDPGDWAESGFPEDPSLDDGSTTFWLLRENGRVSAAGNMTEWRGRPSDVGVLAAPAERGRGLAQRLVGAMVDAALPAVGVVRYRALASNAPSLAVARRLGFHAYGANFRARRVTR
jgi:GNAT superfamily N-acetyltransferase